MKKISSSMVAAFIFLVLTAGCTYFSFAQQQKIRVLVISGGHGFKHEAFYDVFNSIPSITYDTAGHRVVCQTIEKTCTIKHTV